MLAATALGLLGYALYRASEVLWGTPTGDSETKERLERAASVVRVLVYGGLAVSAARIAFGAGSSSQSSDDATSTAFDLPAGQVLVLIAGCLLIGVAGYQLYRGLTGSFEDDLRTDAMSPWVYGVIKALGGAGHIARAVVFAMVGAFLVKAAVEHDPEEAKGLDAALSELVQQEAGPLLLGLVAGGLVVMGAYSLAEARYRKL